MIDADELRAIEPHAAGLRAIHSPHTAIVDYPGVCRALLARLRRPRGPGRLRSPLVGVAEEPAACGSPPRAPASARGA
jgi:(S)-2-hydroxyglutarate dehydrogenase